MLIQTNQSLIRKPTVSDEAIEAWLDRHPEKRAENLTGVINKDAHTRFVINSESARPRCEKTKSIVKPKATKDNRSYRFRQTQKKFEQMLKDGRVVTKHDLKPFGKSSIATMVRNIRTSGQQVITLMEPGGSVGWISAKTLDDIKSKG